VTFDLPRFYSMQCLCKGRHAVAEGQTSLCPRCKTLVFGTHITSENYFAVTALLSFVRACASVPSGAY
jgi:hypothetical protein